jgi:hypothetical protein
MAPRPPKRMKAQWAWGQRFGAVQMGLRPTSNHENAPDTVSFVFNYLRRAFNGSAELTLGAELDVRPVALANLVAGDLLLTSVS